MVYEMQGDKVPKNILTFFPKLLQIVIYYAYIFDVGDWLNPLTAIITAGCKNLHSEFFWCHTNFLICCPIEDFFISCKFCVSAFVSDLTNLLIADSVSF